AGAAGASLAPEQRLARWRWVGGLVGAVAKTFNLGKAFGKLPEKEYLSLRREASGIAYRWGLSEVELRTDEVSEEVSEELVRLRRARVGLLAAVVGGVGAGGALERAPGPGGGGRGGAERLAAGGGGARRGGAPRAERGPP